MALKIYTASWFTPLPPTIQRVGISRGTPRGYKAGYRRLNELNPGPWFLSAPPMEYVERYYDEILKRLRVRDLVGKLVDMAADKEGVALLCYERPPFNAATYNLCHRRIVASFLENEIGNEVPEFLQDGVSLGDNAPPGAGMHDWLRVVKDSPHPQPKRAGGRRPQASLYE